MCIRDSSNTLTLGATGQARTEITDTSISMYDGQATPRKRVAIDNTGKAAFGGASGADVSVSSTDDVVRIEPGTGVFIFDNSTDFVKIHSSGMDIHSGNASNPSATFGTEIAMFPNGGTAKSLHITEHGINIGPSATGPSSANTPSAVAGNVSVHGQGVRIYGAATNDYVDVKSDGVDVVAAGTTRAAFGATTTIGDSSNEHISIDSDSVDIIQDANNKAVVSSAGLNITQGGVNVSSFGATVRVGVDHAEETALRVDSDGDLTIGNSSVSNFSISSSGDVRASEVRLEKSALIPSISQGVIFPGAGTDSAWRSYFLYYSEVYSNSGGTSHSPVQRLLDIAGDQSSIAPTLARGANFIRFESSFFDNKVITHIRFKRGKDYGTAGGAGTYTADTDMYRVGQIMIEGAAGNPFLANGTTMTTGKFVDTTTSLSSYNGAKTEVGGLAPTGFFSMNGCEINVDTDDFWRPAFTTTTVGSDGEHTAFEVTSGNRIILLGQAVDVKLVTASSFEGIRTNLDGGLNIGTHTGHGSYELYVSGDIGATGNITAYADYVCNSCGWHSAAETKVCPSCGSTDVHYHDDVELLKQIIDVSAAYPDDVEKQYGAYKKLAHLGVIDVHMPGSKGTTGMREKDLSITHNLHAMNNYLISGLVQERKRSEGLEERIDKLESIIETFGHEPYKGVPHNNDGILAKNATPGYGYNRKNEGFAGDYDKEKDSRVIHTSPAQGIKIFGASLKEGPLTKVKNLFKKKTKIVKEDKNGKG